MASAAVPVKYLNDITECPICTQVFTDPRVLPCIHTFCLTCIKTWGQSKDKVACPLCRKNVDVTEGKYDELPKNFFVEKLLEVKNLSSRLSQKVIPCDVCSVLVDNAHKAVKTSTVHCVHCQKNMCAQCGRYHQAFAAHSSHKMVDVSDSFQVDELLIKYRENYCDKHQDKKIEIYCFDCKVPTCLICFVMNHSSHKGSDVKQVAEEMSIQIKGDVDKVSGKVKECDEALEKLAKSQKEFKAAARKVEKEIVEKAEQLKQWIENHKLKLLEELATEKKKQEKQVKTLRHEVEDQLLMIESFKKYSDELRTKGTACDIVREARGLHDRAIELTEFDANRNINVNRNSVDIKFTSQTQSFELKDVFGELKFEEIASIVKKSTSSFTDFPDGSRIRSMGQSFVSRPPRLERFAPYQLPKHLSPHIAGTTGCATTLSTLTEMTVNRFDASSRICREWFHRGQPDAIDFQTSFDGQLVAVGLYGTKDGSKPEVTINVTSTEAFSARRTQELSRYVFGCVPLLQHSTVGRQMLCQMKTTLNSTSNSSPIRVTLNNPVEVRSGVRYTISTLQVSSQTFASEGSSTSVVQCAKGSVSFFTSTDSQNSTDVNAGQIPQLIFWAP